ncbi:MAG: restriction endonuclease subunit M [Bacilli bacterium]|nr:restriction endonuclease subunit M [Bacilli bacterium]
MNLDEKVDIKENSIYNLNPDLLSILLYDNTTKRNIIWATDMYENRGFGYETNSQITIDKITGRLGQVIKPRIKKSKQEQDKRIKVKAEVFTPSWICNEQNNLADSSWFEKMDIFNKSEGTTWKTNKNKVQFSNNKTWHDYVDSVRLEISCGEAPYLVSRYDTTTGDIIPIIDRIGLLDRKLRIVNENTNDKNEWYENVLKAYKSIYGFEWQGDSLLIARENLLYTFMDYYIDRFNEEPNIQQLKEIATIISWNIFQMDGLKFVIPNSCKNEIKINYTLFGEEKIENECLGCKKGNIKTHNGIYVKIMNWNTNKQIKFLSLFNRKK